MVMLAFVCLIVADILVFSKNAKQQFDPSIPRAVITFPNGKITLAEVADDATERVQGLSDKQKPQSMLFLFEEKVVQSFWMKDMNFPIDLLWIDESRIVGIEQNMQPETPVHTLFSSTIAVNTVLELPVGSVDELHLKVGDALDIEWNPQ